VPPRTGLLIMHGLKGERVLMRIYVEEQDKWHGRPLYEAIIQLLHDRGLHGATAFNGIVGFGPTHHVHAEHAWHITLDEPVVVECVDTAQGIESVLAELDPMIGSGLITLERVRVIMYRKNTTPAERDEDAQIDVTGSWRVPMPPAT
jgi:PII-like signaling protein